MIPKFTGEDDLRLAQQAAYQAATAALDRKESGEFEVAVKGDGSPVTSADTAAESLARELIGCARPDDGFAGEESGGRIVNSGRVWVVDPIDGTRNFVRGIPVWATLVALVEEGAPVVGVVYAPELKRCWWAQKGGGAYCGETPQDDSARRIQVRRACELREAYISTTALKSWYSQGLYPQYRRLAEQAVYDRGFGDFWQHCLVAEGLLDASLEPIVAPWDAAALIPIVEEAGGICSDLTGRPVLAGEGPGLLSAGPVVHRYVVDIFTEQQ